MGAIGEPKREIHIPVTEPAAPVPREAPEPEPAVAPPVAPTPAPVGT